MGEAVMSRVCVIAGAGPGNGRSLGRRFSREGYKVVLLARSEDHVARIAAQVPDSTGLACDLTDEAAVTATFRSIADDFGPVDTLIYNAGNAVWGDIESLSPADFEQSWRVNTLGLVHATQAVLPDMKVAGTGNIAVIGATASKRGGAGFAASERLFQGDVRGDDGISHHGQRNLDTGQDHQDDQRCPHQIAAHFFSHVAKRKQIGEAQCFHQEQAHECLEHDNDHGSDLGGTQIRGDVITTTDHRRHRQ